MTVMEEYMESELRRLFLSNPKMIKQLSLSNAQRKLYKKVFASGGITSSGIADRFDIAIQSASGRLRELYNKGYLTRQEIPQDSGGYEWFYRAITF